MWHLRAGHTGLGFSQMKISPAISINKKCHSHWQLLAFKCWVRTPKTVIQGMLPPPAWWLLRSWENARSSRLPLLKMNREPGLAPDSWAAYGRNESSESRGLHLPRSRMLTSLTWYLTFDVQSACSLCCRLVYRLTSPPASLEQFCQSCWDTVSRAWSPKHSHQIK